LPELVILTERIVFCPSSFRSASAPDGSSIIYYLVDTMLVHRPTPCIMVSSRLGEPV